MNSQRLIAQRQGDTKVQASATELLKLVLDNLDSPEQLDQHPWVHSRMVSEQCSRQPGLLDRPRGQQLTEAVAQVFQDSLPPAPPRQGKRLDTRWAQFGLLAARYFYPFRYKTSYPVSLREAWHGMDAAIQSFVFDGRQDAGEAERLRYALVANEPEVAPESTLSDWHRQGTEKLAAAIERREKTLQSLPVTESGTDPAAPVRKSRLKARWLWPFVLVLLALLITGTVLGVREGKRVYAQALVVWKDASSLKALAGAGTDLSTLKQAGPALALLRSDFNLLKSEVDPYLPLGRWLRWVPVYGGDLASAGTLVETADLVLQGGEQAYSALTPFVEALETGRPVTPPEAVAMLKDAVPGLTQARQSLDRASALRAGLEAAQLSPRTRGLLEQYLDPLLPRLQDGLDAALALPPLLGATSEGPKTYLLLAQNEDELRATGGFITAAGNLVIRDGQIQSLAFKDSGALDNWAMPYPPAPWQLDEYMNSPVLILRDSNWFTDFPVAAEYAEYLYSYVSDHSVDGVIAFDQHSLVMLLQVLGSVEVEGQDGFVDASNVLAYMRKAKTLGPADGVYTEDWTNKSFLGDLAAAVLHKLYATPSSDWQALAKTLLSMLQEKHLLVQLDDPKLSEVLSRYGWNGSVTPAAGDFLLVVDSNVGFNKTNAVVSTDLIYDVDLTDLSAPVASLTTVHKNGSPLMEACKHWDKVRVPGQEKYPIDDCYWDYMRVYTPAGAELLDSEAQDIPAAWMIQDTPVKAHVDVLDEEEIPGLQAFGAMLVVPGGRSVQTGMSYSLPAGILAREEGSGLVTYRLTVKKQPGTVAVPITIRLHLPAGASVEAAPGGATLQGSNLLFTADLRRDLFLEVDFSLR